MIDKTVADCAQAVAGIFEGATVMLGGFGIAGQPAQLAEALRRQGTGNLVVICNGAGPGDFGLGGLFIDGRVRKLVASFPAPSAKHFREGYLKGKIELELVPQGTLAERIRAAGAGIGGFYTPTGVGTELAGNKETRVIDGKEYVFELPLSADFVFVKAHQGDRFGNLSYRGTMRNFNMVMATAGKVVIAEVDEIVPAGTLRPDAIHTPGIYVDKVVQVARHPGVMQKRSKEKTT